MRSASSSSAACNGATVMSRVVVMRRDPPAPASLGHWHLRGCGHGSCCLWGTSMTTPVAMSLIVPAYNEAERLPATLRNAAEKLPRLAAESEIIVVDDGSNDQTTTVAEQFASPVPLRVIRLPRN